VGPAVVWKRGSGSCRALLCVRSLCRNAGLPWVGPPRSVDRRQYVDNVFTVRGLPPGMAGTVDSSRNDARRRRREPVVRARAPLFGTRAATAARTTCSVGLRLESRASRKAGRAQDAAGSRGRRPGAAPRAQDRDLLRRSAHLTRVTSRPVASNAAARLRGAAPPERRRAHDGRPAVMPRRDRAVARRPPAAVVEREVDRPVLAPATTTRIRARRTQAEHPPPRATGRSRAEGPSTTP
jgi:hypothetical protein